MYVFKDDATDQIGLAGIAQAEIARAADLDRHRLNKKINGRTPLRLPTAARIARVRRANAHDAGRGDESTIRRVR